MAIPKGFKLDVQKHEKRGFGRNSYAYGAEEIALIKQHLKANAGSFSVPLSQAKELVGYDGEGSNTTFVTNLKRRFEREKLDITAGACNRGTRVAFYQLSKEEMAKLYGEQPEAEE